MASEIVAWGAARATHYALRDRFRGLADIPVWCIDAKGQIKGLGQLIPVRPEGFVMLQADGVVEHFEGLPWWLTDMRPQGFLGRAYAHQHATSLGLPPDVRHWSDTDALRVLLRHGGDTVGNLLLGDVARDRFVNAPASVAVLPADYPRLASEILSAGETWSSAGGEQPKFCTTTATVPVLVKFTAPDDNPITERWRDLLLAEHLALQTLAAGGCAAPVSRVLDVGTQRFLELARFDRVGTFGRLTLVSLAALDGAFVGNATAPWPVLAQELARQKIITPEAQDAVTLQYAFGTLIGNTDMHAGNLSFVSDHDRPYDLSPAYDMLPMAFAPTSGGAIHSVLPTAYLHPAVSSPTWRTALGLANDYLARLGVEARFSAAFAPCLAALGAHVLDADKKIGRLG